MFPIHRLLLIVFLSIFAAPAFAQTNPTPDKTCGLPKQGTIVTSVTYTLKANCEQTGTLDIKTANTPNITVTINGEGFTISNGSVSANQYSRMSFLIVNDQGVETNTYTDTTTSSNVRVVINDVTFDGKDKRFRRPCDTDPGTWCRGWDKGLWINVEGTLEMEDVTFTRGEGVWVRAMGTTTLNNVLFEESSNWVSRYGYYSHSSGVLHVAKTGRVTLNNAVFRDIERTVVAIEKGGRLSATGCLRFIRVWTHKVFHSGLYNAFGTWSDSSTGPCGDSMTIGNGDTVWEAYTLPLLDCGLPSSGIIEGTIVYTLAQDCVCMNEVIIAAGSSVTINGNGHRIQGCSTGAPQFRIGHAHVTINNARIYGVRVRNYGGYFTLRNSMVAAATKPIMNYGWAYLFDSVFEGNRATWNGGGKAYYGGGFFSQGRALFQDNMFRGNTPVDEIVEAYTTGRSTAIYLCGDNILDGLPEDANGPQLPLFMATNGGRILGCPQPDQPQPAPAALNCVTEHTDLPENKLLGAIGIIFYKQKCPAVIEIWEVLPNSQGQFALTASQSDVEAVAQGVVACSSNGRAAVRVGLPEPVLRQIAHSNKYQAVSPRKARDILISMGPNAEGKLSHMVIDNALDGSVLGIVSTFSDEGPCQAANLSNLLAVAAPPPQPTAIPYAASVAPQAAQEDGSIIHVVQSGDTIWQIGIAYDVHPFKIISLNQLDQLRNRGRYIFPGQELLIRAAE